MYRELIKLLLSAPRGFSDHQGRHLFGTHMIHIGFDAALPAGVKADIPVDIFPRFVRLQQFIQKSTYHTFSDVM